MKAITMTDFADDLKLAHERGFEYVGVRIEMPNLKEAEIIINPTANFIGKMHYYKQTYNEDMTHKYAPGIKITHYIFRLIPDSIVYDLEKVNK